MAKYNYKVTDIDALAEKYPQAVVTIKSPNRQELGKLVRASMILGAPIPGVEVMVVPPAQLDLEELAAVPNHMKGAAKND